MIVTLLGPLIPAVTLLLGSVIVMMGSRDVSVTSVSLCTLTSPPLVAKVIYS